MLWKRSLEQIAQALHDINKAPWRVFCEGYGDHIKILDADENTVLSIPADTEDMPKRLYIWHLLELYCLLRNNSELWFDEMKKCGISDIVLPKKKPKHHIPFKPIPAEPSEFNVNEILSKRGDHYECEQPE